MCSFIHLFILSICQEMFIVATHNTDADAVKLTQIQYSGIE